MGKGENKSSFMSMVFAKLEDYGINTEGMSGEEAYLKYQELIDVRKNKASSVSQAKTQDDEKKKAPTKKVVKVNLDSEIQKKFDCATPKERQKIAFDYIMKNLRGKYPTEDGRVVSIERVGAKKITHDQGEIKIRVVPDLGKFIQAGEFIETKEANHKYFKGFAYYKVSFQFGKELYSAILNVGIRENGDSTLYEINQFHKNK